MKVRIRHWWDVVSSGYWFVPSVMTAAAGFAAFAMLFIDRTFFPTDVQAAWLYSGGADGAKTLLSTVAGSVITVAGVVFSITIAALTQASAQFGPRLLRNFMRDRSNQVVLGTFVATFLYCLLILRTIHGKLEDGSAFIPQASVTGAVLMAIASIAVLIYFIHHVSVLLQAPSIVAAVFADFGRVMDELAEAGDGLGKLVGRAPAPEKPTRSPDADACSITAASDGYVQAIDYDQILRAATEADLVVELVCRPGDYAIAGNSVARARPSANCKPQLRQLINGAFIFGDHRTAEQDAEFAVRQIVEIAVRALSPGINDPFTAINCINALGSVTCRVARSGLAGPLRYDDTATLRLITPVSTFAGVSDVAFNQIRQYGRDSVAVTLRLLEVFGECAAQLTTDDQRRALLRHAKMVYQQGENAQAIWAESDRAEVRQRWEITSKSLGCDPATCDVESHLPHVDVDVQ